jgi:hypothetical protein
MGSRCGTGEGPCGGAMWWGGGGTCKGNCDTSNYRTLQVTRAMRSGEMLVLPKPREYATCSDWNMVHVGSTPEYLAHCQLGDVDGQTWCRTCLLRQEKSQGGPDWGHTRPEWPSRLGHPDIPAYLMARGLHGTPRVRRELNGYFFTFLWLGVLPSLQTGARALFRTCVSHGVLCVRRLRRVYRAARISACLCKAWCVVQARCSGASCTVNSGFWCVRRTAWRIT